MRFFIEQESKLQEYRELVRKKKQIEKGKRTLEYARGYREKYYYIKILNWGYRVKVVCMLIFFCYYLDKRL